MCAREREGVCMCFKPYVLLVSSLVAVVMSTFTYVIAFKILLWYYTNIHKKNKRHVCWRRTCTRKKASLIDFVLKLFFIHERRYSFVYTHRQQQKNRIQRKRMRAVPQAIERQQQLVTKQAPCNLLNPSNYKAINMILFSLRLLHVDVTVFTGVYKLSFINSFERAPFTPWSRNVCICVKICIKP